jgi:hypothetical protein
MSEEKQRADIAKKAVVYRTGGMDAVNIRHDVPYRTTDAGVLTMDVYSPPDAQEGARTPAVVFAIGFSDLGAERFLGCKFKEMESYIGWGKLTAASGLTAITYTTTDPATDIQALLSHVRENAASLGIDGNKIGVWACSGNVPLALSVLIEESREYLKCAALCYGYMLDLDGHTSVAEASKKFGFVNPCAGKSVDDLPDSVPLCIVRAGRDETPQLNETMDRFLAHAVARNLPVTFVNHAAAPHAFDLFHDSETSREIIRQILAFLRFHLLA